MQLLSPYNMYIYIHSPHKTTNTLPQLLQLPYTAITAARLVDRVDKHSN